MPETLDVLLQESTIRRFAKSLRQTETPNGSVGTIRSRLRALARLHHGEFDRASGSDDCRSTATTYDEDELEVLRGVRAKLRRRDQQVLDAYLHLGLGVGPTRDELTKIDGLDVVEHIGLGVAIGGSAARWVPVQADHAPAIRVLRDAVGAGPLTGVASRDTWIERKRIGSAGGIELDATRLRATWMQAHLRRGVPLHVLVAGAGARIAQLNDLVAGLSLRPDAEVLAWLAWSASRASR